MFHRPVIVAGVAALFSGVRASAQETTRISIASNGNAGGGEYCGISDDGNVVVFASQSKMVPGDANNHTDVFVMDRTTGTYELVSVDSSGNQGNGDSCYTSRLAYDGPPMISADGIVVAFPSLANNFVAGDTNHSWDVFVHDRSSGLTERVSVDSGGAEANDQSRLSDMSSDGRFVVFSSPATNLVSGDTNGRGDVFVRDRANGTTERVDVDSSGAQVSAGGGGGSISDDGRFVAFTSSATDLVAGDTNGFPDVFVHDRTTGTTERVSVDSNGAESDSYSNRESISADGRFVAFWSLATNLVAGDTNGRADIFVHDRTTGITERVSVDSSGNEGNGDAHSCRISADGSAVIFDSEATNLVPGDTNGYIDTFLHDRSRGTTERVSVDSSGVQGDLETDSDAGPAISGDGSVAVFVNFSTNLVPPDYNNFWDVFAHERCMLDASWSNYGSGVAGAFGVPSLLPRGDPVLGSIATIDLANSSGQSTPALVVVGLQSASLHTPWGGDLLVLPTLFEPVAVPANGVSFTGGIGYSPDCGVEIDLQALELDAAAVKGVSMTQGLQLLLGR